MQTENTTTNASAATTAQFEKFIREGGRGTLASFVANQNAGRKAITALIAESAARDAEELARPVRRKSSRRPENYGKETYAEFCQQVRM